MTGLYTRKAAEKGLPDAPRRVIRVAHSEKAMQGLHDRFTLCDDAVQVLHGRLTHCEDAVQVLHGCFAHCD